MISTSRMAPSATSLRHQCGLSATAPPDVVTTRVARLLQSVELAPEDSAPSLLQLLGEPGAGERQAALTPEALKARLFATLRQVHLRSSQQQPLCLIVENLHWLDSDVGSLPGLAGGAPCREPAPPGHDLPPRVPPALAGQIVCHAAHRAPR